MIVSIIGRPNVGKSTIFNRLAGGKFAIVGDLPGVTRDRKYADADLFGLKIQILDTPGVDPFSKSQLAQGMNEQSFAAINESDVILFVVDAIEGVTEYDKEIAAWVRSALKKIGERQIILVKNKCENQISYENRALAKVGNRISNAFDFQKIKRTKDDFFKNSDFALLGFGESIAISAEHNLGFDDLYEVICDSYQYKCDSYQDKIVFKNPIRQKIERNIEQKLKQKSDRNNQKNITTNITDVKKDIIKIAIVGRPNVGKSTMINAILGSNRLLTGEQAGITRDAISVEYTFKSHKFAIIDTAGQRKKSKVDEKIESTAVLDAWRYIKQSNVVVVVMDIQNPLEKQDVTIARKAFDEGKIIIFALNKSDTVENPEKILADVEFRASKEFAQLPGIKCLLVSAKEKKGLARIFNTAMKLVDSWSMRIPTAQLNSWFSGAIAQNPPPLVNGMPIKLKYISQTNIKPPTFVVFANRAEHLPASYERYLLNQLREYFKLSGIPLRIFVRQRENPHVKKRK